MSLQPHALVLATSLVVAAFLSLGEASLLGMSRVRRRQLVEEDHPRIRAVERLLESPQDFVLGEMALRMLAVAAGTVAAALAVVEIGTSRGWPFAATAPATVVVVAVLFLVVGEIFPKALGQRHAERLSLALAPALRVLLVPVRPLAWALRGLAARALAASGKDPEEGAVQLRSEEELKTLISLGTEEGLLAVDEEEMIHSVIEFRETTVQEIMVPRADMTAVPGDATLDQVKDFVIDSAYSRVPVYQGSLDNVVGVLYLRDLLMQLLAGNRATPVKELMRDAFFVPETKRIRDLLKEMQAKRTPFSVVLDEYGVTAGIVTLEDIVEEIVGEITDEDEPSPEPVRRIDDRTAVVDGRTHVADLNAALGLDIPEDGPFDTVGGFVFHELGRLGREGETVNYNGFSMTVEKVTNRRILRVRVAIEPKAPQVEGTPEPGP